MMNRVESTMEQLKREFHERMEKLADETQREVGRPSPLFRIDLAELGGVDAAKKYLDDEPPASGFTDLYLLGRVDLTVEWVVAREAKWAELFTPKQMRKARSRISDEY